MSSPQALPPLKVFNALNLYEYWLLTELTPSLSNFLKMNTQEKKIFLEDLSIYYVFNIRRHLDPLFSANIYLTMQKDTKFYQTLHASLSSLLQKTFTDKAELKAVIDKSNVRNEILKNDEASVSALEFYSHPESLITIYKTMQIIVLAEGNLGTLEAVNTFLGVLEKVIYAIKDIYETENSYGTVYPLGVDILELKKFVLTHIQHIKHYTNNIPSNRIILMNLCASKFVAVIIDAINDVFNDAKFLQTQSHFNKVIGNFLSILCSFWFMSQPLEERVRLLNGTYSSTIWLESVKEGSFYADFSDLQIWNFYLNVLSSLGCFPELRDILNYLLENIPVLQPVEKVFFLDHLAFTNLQLKEYLSALKNLADEKNLVLSSQTVAFKKNIHASILKNQAECYYHLQDQENFARCLVEIDDALLGLEVTDRSSILYFLSLLGKDLSDRALEKKYLAQLIALPNSDSYTKYATERTAQLAKDEEIEAKTSEEQRIRDLQTVFRQVEFVFSTFNFGSCIGLIEKVKLSIDTLAEKHNKIDFYRPLALSYMFTKAYALAEETFHVLLQEDNEHSQEYKLFLLVLGILTNNSELIEPYLSALRADMTAAYDIKNLRLILYFIIPIANTDSIEPFLNVLEHVSSTDKVAFFRSLAATLSDYGFLVEAKSYLNKALNESKGRLSKSAIYYDMANLLVKQQLFTDAISFYVQAIETNENDSRTYLNKACVHSYLFEYEAALENIAQALNVWDTINPHEKEFYLYTQSLIQESTQVAPILNDLDKNTTQRYFHQYEIEYLQFMFCDSNWYGNMNKIFIQYLVAFQNILDIVIAKPFLKYYNERYANLTFGVNWKSQELALKKYTDSHGLNTLSIPEWRVLLKNYLVPLEKRVPKFDEFAHKFMKGINFSQVLTACERISPVIDTLVTASSYDSNTIILYHRVLIEEINNLYDIFK